MKTREVVIVGAGPMGLAMAVGIKKIAPHLDVVVLEKYQEYQRKHSLIMKPEPFEAFLDAIDAKDDAVLAKLLADRKKNERIRTKTLQETLSQRAIDLGVTIQFEDVKQETLAEQLCRGGYAPDLVIGADGTHSVINKTLFPANNHVKYEFDYALQLRYEIEGDASKIKIPTLKFTQDLVTNGIVATELVGSYDAITNKTPVTVQIIINKETFDTLRHASSKSPIDYSHELMMEQLPDTIRNFINQYVINKLKQLYEADNLSPITQNMTISVNELPAILAESMHQVVTLQENNLNQTDVLLVGDASLALSYFKGINAGFESLAGLFKHLKSYLMSTNFEPIGSQLDDFKHWRDEFAQRKIGEVASYSRRKVRLAQFMIDAAFFVKGKPQGNHQRNNTVLDAFIAATQNNSTMQYLDDNGHLKIYPHRDYTVSSMYQFSYLDHRYTLKKIAKIFTDYAKRYKDSAQVSNDFLQPLYGLWNLSLGFLVIARGIFTATPKYFADGLLRMLRGLIEVVTTPFTYLLKPIIRGLHTAIVGTQMMEENIGINKLTDAGLANLQAVADDAILTKDQNYPLIAIAWDLHRKFLDAEQRGQACSSKLKSQEYAAYTQIDTHGMAVTARELKYYFRLFKPELDAEITPIYRRRLG